MSYSRWSNSRWYTFWNTTDSKFRADQCFSVCGETMFTYEELITDIQSCLDSLMNGRAMGAVYSPPTKEELEELRIYMMRFISDVESDRELVPDFNKII